MPKRTAGDKQRKLFHIVKKWLDDGDFMGLLRSGAPSDEYTPEAEAIAAYIEMGGLEIGDFCFFYWQHMFMPYPKETFQRVRREWYSRANDLLIRIGKVQLMEAGKI